MTKNILNCQQCGAALDSSSLDRRLGIITCGHCNSIFDLVKQRDVKPPHVDSGEDLSAENKKHVHYRAPAALPEGYQLTENTNALIITKKWNKRGGLKSGLFSIVFSVIWLAVVITQFDAIAQTKGPWLINLFLLPFIAVGVSMLYRGLASLLNTTSIIVDDSHFQIRHAPLPWYPAPQYNSADIEQIYIKQHRRESRRENSNNVKIHYHYSVHAILRGKQSQALIKGLPHIEQALFLEQAIEQFLQLRDRAVAGEYVPDAARH